MVRKLNLCAGEYVEVLSKAEILRTLDRSGRLDGLPFMPEMFAFCGRRLRVFKRAHKTCDPPNGLKARWMASAVHLEGIRCDGQAHGGCQAGCLIFWKVAWLKRVGEGNRASDEPAKNNSDATEQVRQSPGCTEKEVVAGAFAPDNPENTQEPIYVCQSTQISRATQPLPGWDLRQYMEDYTSGNVKLSQILAAFCFFIYHTVAGAGLGLGAGMRWAYDLFQQMRGGAPYPWRMGTVPKGTRTPAAKLDLRPGEMVKVKSYPEILATLDENWCNRGMYFDAESVPFCNRTFRILTRVEQIIDEKTGKMLKLQNDAIILDGVYCQARYAKCRRFCPRSIYPYWREIWLERVPAPVPSADKPIPDSNDQA